MKKLFDGIFNFYMVFCKIMFLVVVIVTAYIVFGRYILHSQPVWGEEIVLMCMTYMALVSSALAIRDESHMKMTVMDYVLPKKVIEALKIFALIGIFVFAVFMIIAGTKFTILMKLSQMTGLRIATSWQYLAVPFAGLSLILMVIEKFLEKLGVIEATKTKAEVDEERNREAGKMEDSK